MTCPNCGERMVGDGYLTILHCPYAREERYEYNEPDASPVPCCDADYEEEKEP